MNSIFEPITGISDAPPDIPVLKEAPPSDYDERAAIAALLAEGYSVNIIDPYGEDFNIKYLVTRELPVLGRQIVLVDDKGSFLGFKS